MNILIAFDGTPVAQAALAAAMARSWPESTVFRIMIVVPQNISWVEDQRVVSNKLYDAQKLINQAVLQMEGAHPYSVVLGQIDIGEPETDFVEFANRWPADLIILGSSEEHESDSFREGSLTESLFRAAKCPLLIVRERDLRLSAGQSMLHPAHLNYGASTACEN